MAPKATRKKAPAHAASFSVSHAPLSAPPRLATPKPRSEPKPKSKPAAPPPPDPFAGLERLGTFVLLGRDPLGKRAIARCLACSTVREIGLTAGIPSCGCGRASRPDESSARRSAFAAVAHIVGLRGRARQ
jgi:hypothetical protein